MPKMPQHRYSHMLSFVVGFVLRYPSSVANPRVVGDTAGQIPTDAALALRWAPVVGAVVHCATERQAKEALAALAARMGEAGLRLYAAKTKIVCYRGVPSAGGSAI